MILLKTASRFNMLSPDTVRAIISQNLPEPHASLLGGITFGFPISKSLLFYSQLKMVGLLHIAVFSGLNLTILTALISSMTKYFSKQVSLMITMLTIIFFVIFVGPQAPTIRAAIVAMLTSVSILLGKKTNSLYALFLSSIAIAIFWPKWVTSISFYLSYGAALGIILFGQKHANSQTENKTHLFIRLTAFVKEELRITMAAQLFTVPIILYHFHQISIISPVSNMLVSFIIPPLMVFGFIMILLGSIHSYLGLFFSYVCYGLLSYVIFVVESLSKLPFGFLQF